MTDSDPDPAQMAFYLSIRQAGVTDNRILAAIENVPRQEFVPEHLAHYKFADHDLFLQGDLILEPIGMLACAIQLLNLKPQSVVLEVGAGSGYALAILSKLCRRVVGLERVRERAHLISQRLEALRISNATVVHGASAEAAAATGPYDAILMSAAVMQEPADFLKLLKLGGVLICPMEFGDEGQWLYEFNATLDPENPTRRKLFEANQPILQTGLG